MKKITGSDFLALAMLAFGGIGLEVIYAFLLEPILYGAQLGEWNTWQNIVHWIITSASWGVVAYFLIQNAKKKYDFDIFKKGESLKLWQWLCIVAVIVLSLIISYQDWNGFKVIKEFVYNGWLKFIFQYIYYIFETVLVTLILVFAQKAFEKWFHKENIPYGGIILALTWGIGHFFTKDIVTGILCIISGFAFGSVYLLTNRDIRKTFPLVLVMFVL